MTDLTTGRTEQRRFSVRVTRDPIHVYVTGREPSNAKLPRSYYISTFYADGAPARCKVQLSAWDKSGEGARKQPLRAVETNKYGLAKATGIKVPDDEDLGSLLAEARDSRGLTGRHVENIARYESNFIHVDASRTIHKPGDPIEVTVASAQPDLRVTVEATREGAVLAAQDAALQNGRASVMFPYDERFSGQITVAAYSFSNFLLLAFRRTPADFEAELQRIISIISKSGIQHKHDAESQNIVMNAKPIGQYI